MPCSSRHLLACIYVAVALCAAYSTAATPTPAPSFTDCVFVVDIRGEAPSAALTLLVEDWQPYIPILSGHRRRAYWLQNSRRIWLSRPLLIPTLPSFDCSSLKLFTFCSGFAGLSDERRLAASVAVGLLNRFFDKPTALALNSPTDWKWVAGIRGGSELTENSRWVAASDADIIAYAVAVGGCLSPLRHPAP